MAVAPNTPENRMLAEAFRRNDELGVRAALSRGADPNCSMGNSHCILTQALLSKRMNLAHALIDAGAQPYQRHAFGGGTYPMAVALDRGYEEVAERLLETQDVWAQGQPKSRISAATWDRVLSDLLGGACPGLTAKWLATEPEPSSLRNMGMPLSEQRARRAERMWRQLGQLDFHSPHTAAFVDLLDHPNRHPFPGHDSLRHLGSDGVDRAALDHFLVHLAEHQAFELPGIQQRVLASTRPDDWTGRYQAEAQDPFGEDDELRQGQEHSLYDVRQRYVATRVLSQGIPRPFLPLLLAHWEQGGPTSEDFRTAVLVTAVHALDWTDVQTILQHWHLSVEEVAPWRTSARHTLLHHALDLPYPNRRRQARQRVQTVQALLGAGADLEATDLNGLTPLHVLCDNSDVTVAGPLFDALHRAGVSWQARSLEGHTPLQHLEMLGRHPESGRNLANLEVAKQLQARLLHEALDQQVSTPQTGSSTPRRRF